MFDFIFNLINNLSEVEKHSSTSPNDETKKNESSTEKYEYDDFFDNDGINKRYSLVLCYAFAFYFVNILFRKLCIKFYF